MTLMVSSIFTRRLKETKISIWRAFLYQKS